MSASRKSVQVSARGRCVVPGVSGSDGGGNSEIRPDLEEKGCCRSHVTAGTVVFVQICFPVLQNNDVGGTVRLVNCAR